MRPTRKRAMLLPPRFAPFGNDNQASSDGQVSQARRSHKLLYCERESHHGSQPRWAHSRTTAVFEVNGDVLLVETGCGSCEWRNRLGQDLLFDLASAFPHATPCTPTSLNMHARH